MTQMNLPIVVMTDHVGSEEEGYTLTNQSKQLLSLARSLTTGQLIALVLNPRPEVDEMSKLGVDIIAVPDLKGISPRMVGAVTDAMSACIDTYSPAAVFTVSNYRGREVAAGLAVMHDAGASVDVTDIKVEDGRLVVSKAVLSGTWETTFHMTTQCAVIAIKTAGMPINYCSEETQARMSALNVEYRQCSQQVSVVRSERDMSATKSLFDASAVVCGGAGTQGDFDLLKQLAQRLDAAIGATRVCTDQGWIDRCAQVGQSGVSISPQLYIGAGISGDIHHVSGIRGAHTIVAINNDPEAQIFELVDFGIVGDIFQVIPQCIEALDSGNVS